MKNENQKFSWGKKKKAKNSSIENRQKQGQSKHYETLA